MTTPQDKAAEAMQLADTLYAVSSDPSAKYWERCLQAAVMLREYAALLQAQPAEPFGCVTIRRLSQRHKGHADQYFFYPAGHPPYLDNVDECRTVYVHPQPAEAGRVPLTDNEIDLLMRSIGLTLADDNDSRMENHAGWERSQRRKIARAIERHHGILPKEQP